MGRFELALGGQFLICRGEGEISGLDPDYLRKHMHATRRTGHKSTRITERVSADKMMVIERTPNADGSVMEDKEEMTRTKKNAAPRAVGWLTAPIGRSEQRR